MKKTMEMVLKNNKENTREKIQSKKRALKRQKTKENLLFGFVAMFIIITTCILLNNLNNTNYKNCMEQNNNADFCQSVYE